MNYREVPGTAVMEIFNVAEKLIYQQEAEKPMKNPQERRRRDPLQRSTHGWIVFEGKNLMIP